MSRALLFAASMPDHRRESTFTSPPRGTSQCKCVSMHPLVVASRTSTASHRASLFTTVHPSLVDFSKVGGVAQVGIYARRKEWDTLGRLRSG
jgi:hypothetical protein